MDIRGGGTARIVAHPSNVTKGVGGVLANERGLIASVTAAVAFPCVLLFLWLMMTFAMYGYGRSAAVNVAGAAASAGAAQDGSVAACKKAAEALLAGTDVLSQVSISCTRTATTATASVTGLTLSLVPGWSPRVTQSASMPVERVTR